MTDQRQIDPRLLHETQHNPLLEHMILNCLAADPREIDQDFLSLLVLLSH